jgi:PAS domain S-box-containing protein
MKHKKPGKPKTTAVSGDPAELRRRAEARLREREHDRRSGGDPPRLFHELEVHQIELEMQNAELYRARNELEAALERYTDLYDFAPVGYLSVDESSAILEANLTGAALLGVERSRLINRPLALFVSPTSRPLFLTFLKKVFNESEHHECEARVSKAVGGTFWAGFRATSAVALEGTRKWCRVAFGDITARKLAEDAQRRVEALTDTNRGLNREIGRRRTVEKALHESEQHQSLLLKQSHVMQDKLRRLSREILRAQEEERKRISRELHDEIAQTLVGIHVQLAALTQEATGSSTGLRKKIARTQRLVERSVEMVHRFARELRPMALDDLGLVPALQAFMKGFTKRTGLQVHFTTFTSGRIKELNNATRTVFYRVAQEALTNVARHARAGVVEVTLEKLPKAMGLEIKDDGKSFQVERILHSPRNARLGLIGMRERVEMVGGSLSIESAPGRGTTVRAVIPFGKPAPEGKARSR